MKELVSGKGSNLSIGTKILVAFLGLSLISLMMFGYVALNSLNEVGDYSEESSIKLGDSATEDSVSALESLGEGLIQQIAVDVAKQLEIYIKDHPDMNVTELQEDTFLGELAVQKVGETGYTAVTDVDSLICRFHSSPKTVNMDLHVLEEALPGFWAIMSKTEGGSTAKGYYDWEEDDGTIRQKYMYIAIVNASTEDGVRFSVAATTYIDEFSKPAVKTRNEIDIATRESTEHIDSEIQSTQNTFLGILIPMLIVISLLAYIISKRITTPILELKKGARVLGTGELDYRVDVKTGDELEELAEAFNDMASDLKHQMTMVEKTTRAKEKIERELQIAHDIQKSFLPIKAPEVQGYKMAGINLPAREVGGDFYDFIEFDDGKIGIVVADVSGKGVPAALFMGISKTLLRANAKRITDPVEALREVNTIIVDESDSGMFVTLFYAILDPVEHSLTFINAGHNPPILLKKEEQEITLLKAKGIPVGVLDDMALESKVIMLEENETIFLYTDGVTEAVNESDEEFGTDKLNALLGQYGEHSPDDIIEEIVREIKEFAGKREQFDDITMVVVKSGGEGN